VAGHPLAVDPVYRPASTWAQGEPPVIERLTLHARSIELPASWEGDRRFTCEVPEDFRGAVEALELAARDSSIE
jgi:23S rRNA-/tRNA-specific pseudouridylate synthase